VSEFAHSARNSLIDRERTYWLTPDKLQWREADTEYRLAYDQIAEMRLIRYASFDGEQYQCKLTAPGQGKLKIRSHHYAGLSRFENRTSTYAPFVRELARRIASASPDARFRAGGLGLQIMWISVLVIYVAVLVLLALAFLGGMDPTPGKIAVIAGLVGTAPFIWRQIGKNRGERFDPADPPGEIIGA